MLFFGGDTIDIELLKLIILLYVFLAMIFYIFFKHVFIYFFGVDILDIDI